MDIILYNIIVTFVSINIGYFLGAIPTGVILCRLLFNEDPREKGSKNSGGTNVGRIFGKKVGAIVIILDAIKAILPIIIVWLILKVFGVENYFYKNHGLELWDYGRIALLIAPLGATIGHCWPIYCKFRGGKAVASYAGYLLSTSWATFIISFLTFGVTLKSTKYVSLSSILAAIASVICSWTIFILAILLPNKNINIVFWNFGQGSFWVDASLEFAILSTIVSGLLIIRHIPNIKRLILHSESKIKWMK